MLGESTQDDQIEAIIQAGEFISLPAPGYTGCAVGSHWLVMR